MQVVALAPSSPANLYAGTLQHGVFKSVDSGNWLGRQEQRNKALNQYIALDASNKNTIYAGILDFGVFQSTDGGNNWVSRNAGLRGVIVKGLAISQVGSHPFWASVNNAVNSKYSCFVAWDL